MISIDYQVENAGWATVTIGNGEKTEPFGVSYLHDSLKELAESALKLRNQNHASVVFMEEPGELKMVLERTGEKALDFELRWFHDWASWNLCAEDDFETVMKGQTTLASYINQVRNVLTLIYYDLGPEKYLEKWVEHEFPMEAFKALR